MLKNIYRYLQKILKFRFLFDSRQNLKKEKTADSFSVKMCVHMSLRRLPTKVSVLKLSTY
jgi:hypothetical protein